MPRSKSGRLNRRKTSRRKNASSTNNFARLPQLQVVPTTSTTMRFQTNVTSESPTIQSIYAVSAQTLCLAAGSMATAAHVAYGIYQFVRLKRIEIWGIAAPQSSVVAGGSPTVSVRWFSNVLNNSGTNTTNSDSSLSSAFPAHVSCGPPQGTSASYWNNIGNSSVLFDIILQGFTNVFVDVHAELRLGDDSVSPVFGTYTTTFTTGNIYYPNLDGIGGALTRTLLPAAQ